VKKHIHCRKSVCPTLLEHVFDSNCLSRCCTRTRESSTSCAVL